VPTPYLPIVKAIAPNALTQHEQSESEQDREEQNLQDLAFREGAHHGVGDDVHQEFDRALLPGLRRVDLDRLGIDRPGIHVHADAGLKDIDHDQANDQRKRGDDLEINQRLQPDAADLLQILHAGDAVHDGAEDDWGDEHLDQLDEPVAERLHCLAEMRVEMAEQDTEHDRGEHLHVEMCVKRLVRDIGRHRTCRHHGLPSMLFGAGVIRTPLCVALSSARSTLAVIKSGAV
jgi:hypothetical protein